MEMREEIESNGAELNEAELKGVSGGISAPSERERSLAQERAEFVCHTCDMYSNKFCAQGQEGLANYLLEHGITSVTHCSKCPFHHYQ